MDRKTARKYTAAAEAAGIRPDGPPVSEVRWAELARQWFPELADTLLRQATWPAIEVHRDYIGAQLAAGSRWPRIHQRLHDERGQVGVAADDGQADDAGGRLVVLVVSGALGADG